MKTFWRSFLAVALAFGAVSLLTAQETASPPASPAQLEEGAAVARHAAEAALRGRSEFLDEAFDRPALLASSIGVALAGRLTDRQREQLAREILTAIVAVLAPRPDPMAVVKPIGATAQGNDAWITMMLPVTSGSLKTDWRMKARHGEWKIEDVVLTDTGRSLKEEAVESLGPPPLAVLRHQHADARRAGWPRLAGLLAVVLVAAVFSRHLRGRDRKILLFAAAAPAFLFLLDGVLAVARIYEEPVQLRIEPDNRLNLLLRSFQRAAARHDPDRARGALAAAVAAGARSQPLHFVLGRVYEEIREPELAEGEFRKALAPPSPAPGAWAGLARLALAANKPDDALVDLDNYLRMTAPDPQSLSLRAVALGRKHEIEEAQHVLDQALALDPDEPNLYDLSARLAAATADAATTIARLREEERLRPLDRETLGRDADFKPLAEDESWQTFLAERPKPPPGRAPTEPGPRSRDSGAAS